MKSDKSFYFELDDKELIELLKKFDRLSASFTPQEIRRALAQIVRPLATVGRKEAPVAKKYGGYVSLKKAGLYKSAYDKAGAYHEKSKGIKKRKEAAPKTIPGQLRRSIGVFYPKRSLKNVVTRVYVGPAFGYKAKPGADGWFGHFIEYGTSKGISPNPYMLRAWMQKKEQIISGIKNDIEKRIEKFRK